MTNTPQPSDESRTLRYLNRRIERLEDLQITPQEFDRAFGELRLEMSQLRTEVGAINDRLDRLETEWGGKIDTILKHITGSDRGQ
jgi:hypothetical protein